ncbi:MAG: gliding motility-associated C-terminal domain-containing protein, partial [Bacteroidota bacterium]
NRNCIDPIISPQNLTFCLNHPFTLETFNSPDATYCWQPLDGIAKIEPDNQSSTAVTITSDSDIIRILLTITQGPCEKSAIVDYPILLDGDPPTTPTIKINSTASDVLCIGDEVRLSSSISSDNYFWTLPDGSTANTPTIQFDSVTVEDAGTYSLYLQDDGGCVSDEVSDTTIQVSSSPALVILNNGLPDFCDEITLEVPDYSSEGFTYQWLNVNDGTNIGSLDENNASIIVSDSGEYAVEVTNMDNCTTETTSVTVNKASRPNSSIDGPKETCDNVDFITFSAASTGADGFELQYEWLLEDTPFSTEDSTAETISLSPTSTGSFTIHLNTRYDSTIVYSESKDGCVDSATLNFNVSETPSIQFNHDDGIQKCPEEVLTVGLTDPPANTINSYSWIVRHTTGDTTATSTDESIGVITPFGTDTVYTSLTIETSIGCEVTNSLQIINFPLNANIIFPDFPDVAGDTITLEEGISIRLRAMNINRDFSWQPEEFIDNPAAETITFFPQSQFNTVALTGVDPNGCMDTTSAVVLLDNLRPKKTFSPNGDGINDCWEILNIEEFEGICEVYIFDAKGRNVVAPIKSFDQGNCIWDGTFSGAQVLEGVYYYVLKCDEEGLSGSGSMLLAR